MAEYIERGAGLVALSREGITRNMRGYRKVQAIPAADVAPVRHGQWENSKNYKGHLFWCSICNHCSMEKSRYCPNCGAKMDGEGTK